MNPSPTPSTDLSSAPGGWKTTLLTAIGLLIISLLTVKFLAWNFWKLEEFAQHVDQYKQAPSVDRLEVREGGERVFDRSFPGGSQLPYLVNGYCPDFSANKDNYDIVFNGLPSRDRVLIKLKDHNALYLRDLDVFFLLIPRQCPPRTIKAIWAQRSMYPGILLNALGINTLREGHGLWKPFKRFVNNKWEPIPTNYDISFGYGKGKLSLIADLRLEKGRLYEFQVEYRTTEDIHLLVRLEGLERTEVHRKFQFSLDNSFGTTYRGTSIMFRSNRNLNHWRFHVMARGKRNHKCVVTVRNLRVAYYNEVHKVQKNNYSTQYYHEHLRSICKQVSGIYRMDVPLETKPQ